MGFEVDRYLPGRVVERITQVRVEEPERILDEAAARRRRGRFTSDGRLVIAAADHPGRFVTAAAGDPLAMCDRRGYLARVLRVLTQAEVDGVMSTPDLLEELLILSSLLREKTGSSFLDGKILMGCMNRGGLAGARFEMLDRFTAFEAAQLGKMGMDAAKLMFRLDLSSPDSGTTIYDCSRALKDLDQHDLPAFLEPLPVESVEGKYKVVKTAEALVKVIGVATALGNSTRLLWLKVPYVEGYARVAASTTCPMLMLGGGSRDDPREVLAEFAAGLAAGSNVRGVLVGRNILFPGEVDPAAMAGAIGALVHRRLGVDEATNQFQQALSQPSPEPFVI